jgi:hypothetical protein
MNLFQPGKINVFHFPKLRKQIIWVSLIVISCFSSAKLKAQAPTITSFSPAVICFNSQVVITGTNLSGVTSVTCGSITPSIINKTATQITIGFNYAGTTIVTNTLTVISGSGNATSAGSLTVHPSGGGQTSTYTFPASNPNFIGGSNNWPFNAYVVASGAVSNKCQWLYLANEFTPSVQSGLIKAIYIKPAVSGSFVFYDLNVKLGNTSLTSLSTTWITGLTTVYNPSSVTLNYTANGWMQINLTTPFQYTGGNIILEISQINYDDYYTSELTINQFTVSGRNGRTYGNTANANPTASDNRTAVFKFDLTNHTPAFTACPSNLNAQTSSCAGTTVSYNAVATGTITPTFSYTFSGATTGSGSGTGSGSTFNIGVTNVVITATNCSGSARCNFTVTVKDNQAPGITCPDPIAVISEPDLCGAAVTYNVTATDNCTGQPTITQTAGLPSGSIFPIGVTTNTFMATDAGGNTSTCSFTVSVKPLITCASDTTINLGAGQCTASTTLTAPAFPNNCFMGNALNFNGGYVDVPNSSSLNPINQWTLETWVKTTVNNVQQCLIEKYDNFPSLGYFLRISSANKILGGIVYNPSSGYFFSSNATINTNTWYHIAMTFNRSTGIIKLYINGTFDSQLTGISGLPTNPGTFSLKLGARGNDAATRLTSGGIMEETRIWSVERTQAQIQASMNSELSTGTGLMAAYHFNQGIAGANNAAVTTAGDASGNGNSGTLTGFTLNGSSSNWVIGKLTTTPAITNNAPAVFNKGATTVTWTVDAGNGISNTCTQTVTVIDNQPPQVITKNKSVTLNNGSASISANDIDDGSNDNCGIDSRNVSPNSWDCDDIGDHEVTLTVTDVNGNSNSATATVTVIGIIPNCTLGVTPSNNTYTGGIPTNIYLGYGPQAATIAASASGGSSFSYEWSGDDLSSSSGSSVTFSPTAEGNYTITCTVTNNYGCENTCQVTFCVKDIRVPSSSNVYLCHTPPGNSNNAQTLSLSTSGVPSHLADHAGDKLGKCDDLCGALNKTRPQTSEIITIADEDGMVELNINPNPFTGEFILNYSSYSNALASIMVYDMAGKLMNQEEATGYENRIVLGAELATGIYLVSFTQGSTHKMFKVVKSE